MVEIRDLKLTYGTELALNGLSLQLEAGNSYALIGPSGCGKSSLLLAIAGLIKPDTGTILIKGQPVSKVRRETGLVLQSGGLLPWKTAWKNAALALENRQVEEATIAIRLTDIFQELGIFEFKDKYPGQLSFGQKQRVALARTLVLEPDLLLLDEPSASLDALNAELIQNLLLDLHAKAPRTTLLVTHNIEEAVFLGEKIIVMERARIRTIIDNPYFGDKDLRFKDQFYKLCLDLRQWLRPEAGEP